jgi:hypothetical protein
MPEIICATCSHSIAWHYPRSSEDSAVVCRRASCRCGKRPKVYGTRRKITVPDPPPPAAVSPERAREIQRELSGIVWK